MSLAVVVALPATVRAVDPPKVAIIVGPVGSLTPTYLALAEIAAATAQDRGATVARAYSPNATPANVLAAVAGANVVIYFGHGYGHPSPYGGLNTAKQNGWALQGPFANGTHGDAGGQVAYYGEDWIVANARPAPGFVMIYSNTCYAPGASEGVTGHPPATPLEAAQRVAFYSRSTFTLGGSAYFATDFDRGAADLVGRLLSNPGATYGSAFVSDNRYVPSGLSIQPHLFSAGQQIWLHRSKYTDGPPNYWYAFAGNPEVTPRRAWDPIAPKVTLTGPAVGAVDIARDATVTLTASEPLAGVSAATVRLLDGAGAEVPAALAYDSDDGKITLRPDAPLRLSERYDVVVSAGISDEAGNALPVATWSFRTRVDADPIAGPVPVVLETGDHRLMRLDDAGALAELMTLTVGDARWVTAFSRARLEGRPGTWLQIADAGLAGWWVAESAQAHAVGIVEEAALDPATTITVASPRATLYQLVEGTFQPMTEMVLPGERLLAVDRRVVSDGRTFVRASPHENGLAGIWLEPDPGSAPAEAAVQRLIEREARISPATISLALGDWTLFRFDDRGRVTERRTIGGSEAQGLATIEALTVGGKRFFVFSGGDLGGWAVADGPGVTSQLGQPAPESRP